MMDKKVLQKYLNYKYLDIFSQSICMKYHETFNTEYVNRDIFLYISSHAYIVIVDTQIPNNNPRYS